MVIRLTGFGQTGPYKSRPGFARIFEAMSGFTNLTGEEGGSPLHMDFPVGDAVAGLFCAFSIAAEVARLRGDPNARGVEVDLAATEALFRLLDPLPVEHEQLGQVRMPAGNCASYTAPSNMYQSLDGVYFSVVASSDAIFARLCKAIGQPQWSDDVRFKTNPARVVNLRELDCGLAAWFTAKPYSVIETTLEDAGIPFSKIYTIADIEQDPHWRARELLVDVPDGAGTVRMHNVVPRMLGTPGAIRSAGGAVGEHNHDVYMGELGLDGDEVKRLEAAGVI